ncbi:MAG TPA: oxygen-independent coproporphyrinogen III oxidase [Beijerinckiaceae bacterium]|nr:oxygen-independent coproporphyrinogen III oxidase [Beijerinckiaceae bacterium]
MSAPETLALSAETIRALATPVPRYTSYPTAPHFNAGVSAADYARWLSELPAQSRLSLYMHIPFCDTLCWFCGCSTKITQKYAPVSSYLDLLVREIGLIGTLVPSDARVAHIHWGGGSPTMLTPPDIARLAAATRAAFKLDIDCEFAIEVDPRGLDVAHIDALAKAGLTRVSIGVQDFDRQVQQAINRVQSFEETRAAVEGFRARGITSLNIDALYGLPHQTTERMIETLRQVMLLRPDRIALFGYAHVPWMKRHQAMIDEAALPDVVERYQQAETAAAYLVAHGYQRIGFDHFALATDSMAIAARDGTLKRNFQGYTVDPADALIGLGATAIGALPQGYVQNDTATGRYMTAIGKGMVATEKGLALSAEDRLRRAVIERLMCSLTFSAAEVRALAPSADLARTLIEEARQVVAEDEYGFVAATGDGFVITEAGRPFMRSIAARFDAYLPRRTARHSVAV